MRRTWLNATLVCGVLDIGYAMALTAFRGGAVGDMLRGVAAGPLGGGTKTWGLAGALAGLGVHFVLMAIMVAAYLQIAKLPMVARTSPWISGLLYGLALYLIMYGLVLPLRFGAPFPPADFTSFALGLLPHIALVGWPLAFMAKAA